MSDLNKPGKIKKASQSQSKETATNSAAKYQHPAKPRLKCPTDASEVKYAPTGASLTKIKKTWSWLLKSQQLFIV
jgi:hypothetical protein